MAGALQRAAEALRDQKVPFALIGGLAVGARGVPRFTADLDFAVSLEAAQEDAFVHALTQRGYGVEALLLDKKTRRPASVRLRDLASELLVDLLFDFVGIEKEIAAEATSIEVMPGQNWPTATCVHLCAMKLVAMRPKDLGDLSVLLPELSNVEFRRLQTVLRRIERTGKAEKRDLLRDLEEIRRRL